MRVFWPWFKLAACLPVVLPCLALGRLGRASERVGIAILHAVQVGGRP